MWPVVCGLWFEKAGRRLSRLKLQATLFILLLLPSSLFSLASAHPANVASSQVKFKADGTFVARVRFDVAAFATGATPLKADDEAMDAFLDGTDAEIKKALADAEARFRAGFASGGSLDRLVFPTVDDVRKYLAADPKPRLPMMLTVTAEGRVPGRTVAFRYPPLVDTVIQTVEMPYEEPVSEPVLPDSASSTLTIPTPEEVARRAAAMTGGKREPSKGGGARAEGGKPSPKPKVASKPKPSKQDPSPLGEGRVGVAPFSIFDFGLPNRKSKIENQESSGSVLPHTGAAATLAPPKKPATSAVATTPSSTVFHPEAEPPSGRSSLQGEPSPEPTPRSSAVLTYLRMGYTHILPEGLDHILFVLGLFLLGSNAKALLKQITAFTVAHSITLALATLNLIRLPGRVIEPLIAASIAFVAIENLTTKEVRPWRTAVVFGFGLVHGMGFAEVFRDAGLSGGGLLTALLSFNVGVELGQLSVVALALLAVGWFRKDARYRPYVVVPASLAIAAVALFWTGERVLGR